MYPTAGQIWPPRDPTLGVEERQDFVLPSSPWTYENGSTNPNLEPYNAHLRSSASSSQRRRQQQSTSAGASSLPPYHPDYQEGGTKEDADSDGYSSIDESDDGSRGKPVMRRGSEGYEVRPVDREDLLRQYLQELGEEPQRYHRYIPQPNSDSEEDSEDDTPLGQQYN